MKKIYFNGGGTLKITFDMYMLILDKLSQGATSFQTFTDNEDIKSATLTINLRNINYIK